MPTKTNIHAAALGITSNFMACGVERTAQSKRRTDRPERVTCPQCCEAVRLLTLHNLLRLHPTTGTLWPTRPPEVLIRLLTEHGLFTLPARWTTPLTSHR